MRRIENKVEFNNETLNVEIGQYINGQNSIRLIDNRGFPYAKATVAMPDIEQCEDEVYIKNYSENEGILDALVDAGIITAPYSSLTAGFNKVWICKLLV